MGDEISRLHRLYLTSSALELSLALPEKDLAQLASSFAHQRPSEKLKAEYQNFPMGWLSSLEIELTKPSLNLIQIKAQRDSLSLEAKRWLPVAAP